jgi:hypothetical protein
LGGERQELTTPRRWRLRHLAGNPFPCRNPGNPPLRHALLELRP